MATHEPDARPSMGQAVLDAEAPDSAPSSDLVQGPQGWKRRLEDPFNTYYRYPIALIVTRWLLPTRITPNQVSMVQPLFAASAGYLLTFDGLYAQLLAVAMFEARSILDCVDGSLARAKRMSSPNGHAIDAMADWLGVLLLYAGIFYRLHNHPPPGMTAGATMLVVAAALVQGGLRSFSSDYFKCKYLGIYERRRDEATELLRDKLLALEQKACAFSRIDAFILRMGYLWFELRRFDLERSQPLAAATIQRMAAEEASPRTKLMSFLWSISSGDAFLSFVMISILLDRLWQGQLFFATFGFAWIVLVIATNIAFFRSYRRAAGEA